MNTQDTINRILMADDSRYMAIQDEIVDNGHKFTGPDWLLLSEASRQRYEFNRDNLKH